MQFIKALTILLLLAAPARAIDIQADNLVVLGSATITGTISTATYASKAGALASTPSACTLPYVSIGIDASGNAICYQPTNITGSAASVPVSGIDLSTVAPKASPTFTGTATIAYANIGTNGHSYANDDANIYGGLTFYGASSGLRIGAAGSALRVHGYTGYLDIGYGVNNGVNKSSPGYPLDVAGTINSDFGIHAATAAITGNATIGGTLGVTGATTLSGVLTVNAAMTVSSVTVPGNVAIGTTTAQTRLNVAGGDIRVQGDSTGFGTVPTSGEGLEIAYDSVNHYAWLGAYNRTTAAYTGNYVDGSVMGLNYYSKGPVIIGGNTSAPGLSLTYGVSAATATVTGPITLNGITYTMPAAIGSVGQYLKLVSTGTASGTAVWATSSGMGDVLSTGSNVYSATNTYNAPVILNSSATFNGGVWKGGYAADIPVIIASGTFTGLSTYTFATPYENNKTYHLVLIGSCTTLGYFGLRFNGDSGSNYEWTEMSHDTSSTSVGAANASASSYLLAGLPQASDPFVMNYDIAVHTSGYNNYVSVGGHMESSYVRIGAAILQMGGGWYGSATVPTSTGFYKASGTCSGKYKITTTGW